MLDYYWEETWTTKDILLEGSAGRGLLETGFDSMIYFEGSSEGVLASGFNVWSYFEVVFGAIGERRR